MPVARRCCWLAAVVTVALAASACADGDQPPRTGAEAFCDAVRESRVELAGAGVSDPGAAAAMADRLGSLGTLAPAEIAEQWQQLTNLFHTVAALDPADSDFRDAVLAEVGRTITAAAEVTSWVQRRCGVDLTTESLTGVAPGPSSAPSPSSGATGTTAPMPPPSAPGSTTAAPPGASPSVTATMPPAATAATDATPPATTAPATAATSAAPPATDAPGPAPSGPSTVEIRPVPTSG